MGYYAINTKKVGEFAAIPGRHELGDVFERILIPTRSRGRSDCGNAPTPIGEPVEPL